MKSLCLALAAVMLLGGCVYTHTTNLSLPPPGARVAQAGADGIALKVSVSDARADRTNIGTLHSAVDRSYKYVVVPNQPVERAVAMAIEAEFAARGYRLANGPAFLLVDIQKADSRAVWDLFRTDVSGDSALVAKVINADGVVLYSHTYSAGEQASNKVFIGNYDEGKVQLEKVMASAIRDLADDSALVQALMQANRRGSAG